MADQALKLVDESRDLPPDQRFSWTLAGWPMAQILWPAQTPLRRERFLSTRTRMPGSRQHTFSLRNRANGSGPDDLIHLIPVDEEPLATLPLVLLGLVQTLLGEG